MFSHTTNVLFYHELYNQLVPEQERGIVVV